MSNYLLIVIGALCAAACTAFEPTFESGSPAWHDRYAKREHGSWTAEHYYRERR